MKKADLTQGLNFLQQQMDQAEKKISDSEKALNEFREKEKLIVTSETGSGGLLEQLGDMQSQFMQTEYEMEYTKAQLEALNEKINEKKQNSNFTSDMINSPQIDKLRSRLMELQLSLNAKLETLTEKDPEVIALKQKVDVATKQLQAEFEKIRKESGITSLDPISELQNSIQESISLDTKLKGLEYKTALWEKRIEEFRKEHPEIAAKQMEFVKLKRQCRVLEQNYMSLTDKYNEMLLLEQMKTSELEIIDKASLPESPIKPREKLTLLLAGILGVMLGLGAAFFLEYLDDSIKLKEDVERFLKLPIMGTIPAYEPFKVLEMALSKREHKALTNAGNPDSKNENDNGKNPTNAAGRIRKRKHRKGYQKKIQKLLSHSILYADEKGSSHVLENYQTLSTNIKYANIDEPVKSILVTSAGPGDGKTSIVNNLGITMAKSGMKVLIIDVDLRRPRQHRIFQQDRVPGITDFLTQKVEPADSQQLAIDELSETGLIRPTSVDNLYLLPAGSHVSNPGMLITSEKIRELIRDLAGQYDMILVDSPPLLSVADPVILSNEIESTLLVIKSGETKQEMAVQAKESLERVDAQILGIVLNDIDYSKQYGSYYYYRHYYGYHYYQESRDEEEG